MPGDVPFSVTVDHGDLLVMDGSAQFECAYRTVPGLQGPRVNLTFRWITQHAASFALAGGGLCSSIVCARFSRAAFPRTGGRGKYMVLLLDVGPPFVNPGVCPPGQHLCCPRTCVLVIFAGRTKEEGIMAAFDSGTFAAKRRRERRLRSWWRHARMSIAAVLATASHHSYPKVDTKNDAPRGQKTVTSTKVGVLGRWHAHRGERPAALSESWPQGQVQRHAGIGYELVQAFDAPVLQMVEQLPDVHHVFATCAGCCRAGYQRAQGHP